MGRAAARRRPKASAMAEGSASAAL